MKQKVYRSAKTALASASGAVAQLKRTNDLSFSADAWREFLQATSIIYELSTVNAEDSEEERAWKAIILKQRHDDDLLSYIYESSVANFRSTDDMASKQTGITLIIRKNNGAVKEHNIDILYAKDSASDAIIDYNNDESVSFRQNSVYVRAVPVKCVNGVKPIPRHHFGSEIPRNPSLYLLARIAYQYLEHVLDSALHFAIRSYII